MRVEASDRSSQSAAAAAAPNPATVQPRSGGRARVAWYLHRLRCMSAQEVSWRSADALRKRAWRPKQVPLASASAPFREQPKLVGAPRFRSALPAGALDTVPADDAKRLLGAADEILAGRWDVLGVTRQDMVAPDWFLDPISGRRAPQAEYCFSVNHRDQAVTGNVKQVWELSRHHHLTILASAYALTGDRRYAERAGTPPPFVVAGKPVPVRDSLDKRNRARNPADLLGLGPAAARWVGGRPEPVRGQRARPQANLVASDLAVRLPQPRLVSQQSRHRRGRWTADRRARVPLVRRERPLGARVRPPAQA